MHDTSSRPTAAGRLAVMLIMVATLLTTGLAIGAAPADAGGDGDYATDVFVGAGDCPGSTHEVGFSALRGRVCRPDGYVNVRNEIECERLNGMWMPASDICIYNGFDQSPSEDCAPPFVRISDEFGTLGVVHGCGLAYLKPGYNPVEVHGVACINSDEVQGSAQAANLSIGQTFKTEKNVTYMISSGEACKFNCDNGFDINCDNKAGDYCPVGLDLNHVSGVKACLAALAAAAPAAPASAAAVPAPVPISVNVGELAYTGNEHEKLGALGAALLGWGALAMAARRRIARD